MDDHKCFDCHVYLDEVGPWHVAKSRETSLQHANCVLNCDVDTRQLGIEVSPTLSFRRYVRQVTFGEGTNSELREWIPWRETLSVNTARKTVGIALGKRASKRKMEERLDRERRKLD